MHRVICNFRKPFVARAPWVAMPMRAFSKISPSTPVITPVELCYVMNQPPQLKRLSRGDYLVNTEVQKDIKELVNAADLDIVRIKLQLLVRLNALHLDVLKSDRIIAQGYRDPMIDKTINANAKILHKESIDLIKSLGKSKNWSKIYDEVIVCTREENYEASLKKLDEVFRSLKQGY